MWEHPLTKQHLEALEQRGALVVPPVAKRLACGDFGRGALPPLKELSHRVRSACEAKAKRNGLQAWQRLGFEEWQPKEAAKWRQRDPEGL